MKHDDTTNAIADREDASDLQRWIDGLLRSSDAAELEAAPSTTRSAAMTAIKKYRSRRARRHSLAVFAAAASVAAFAMWPNTPLPRREGAIEHGRPESTVRRAVALAERLGEGLTTPPLVQTFEAQESLENPSLRGRGMAAAMFVSDGDSIAVPLESPATNVTVVQLYPTLETDRRRERQLSLYRTLAQANGG